MHGLCFCSVRGGGRHRFKKRALMTSWKTHQPVEFHRRHSTAWENNKQSMFKSWTCCLSLTLTDSIVSWRPCMLTAKSCLLQLQVSVSLLPVITDQDQRDRPNTLDCKTNIPNSKRNFTYLFVSCHLEKDTWRKVFQLLPTYGNADGHVSASEAVGRRQERQREYDLTLWLSIVPFASLCYFTCMK